MGHNSGKVLKKSLGCKLNTIKLSLCSLIFYYFFLDSACVTSIQTQSPSLLNLDPSLF